MKPGTWTAVATLLRGDGVPEEKLEEVRRMLVRKHARRRLVTTKEAAGILGVHPKTVKRWGIEGKLEPVRLSPRKYRWDADTLEHLRDHGEAAA